MRQRYFFLPTAAIIAFIGCTQPKADVAPVDVVELGPPRVDTLFQGRWYCSECHLEVYKSSVPELRGIPNATAWNDSIRAVFDQEIRNTYADCKDYGEESYTDPTCGGCYSDTVAYISFEFDVLAFTDSMLCLETKRMWYPHGGNGWSAAYRLWNIDVRTGEEIPIPEWVRAVDVAATDKFISDFFGDNGIGNFYECHSCEAPGYIDRLIREHHIGLIDGEWVGFEMIWPTTHGHADKQIVEIPLARSDKEARGDHPH